MGNNGVGRFAVRKMFHIPTASLEALERLAADGGKRKTGPRPT